MNGTTHLIVDI